MSMVAERRRARLRVSGLAVACLLSWPSLCLAQTPAAQSVAEEAPTEPTDRKTEARESFLLGAGLARQGQWVDALVAFERSYRLHPHPTTLFNIGFCERALGRFTRARKSFRAALSTNSVDKQSLQPDLATDAKGYLQEVESRIVRATVVIRQPSLRITVNGRPLEAETSQPQGQTFFVAGTRDSGPPEVPPVAVFELLLDPGEQSIVISADGVDHVITRRFEAGSTPRIELSAPTSTPPTKPRSITVPVIAYSIGAAGLVVGSVFGIATLQNAKTLSKECPQKDACPESAQGDVDASHRNAIISNVGFGVALAGGIVGTWSLLSSQPNERPTTRATHPFVQASLGVGRVNLEGSF
ncbi:MAG TPA: tetratricopeptide repeat protein [Polyangiaceae bacterium]|nr:tetratricopeptide repeat protein [Polyangiaceae bacterium]